jgi:preprotein translocase subunit Sss1
MGLAFGVVVVVVVVMTVVGIIGYLIDKTHRRDIEAE